MPTRVLQEQICRSESLSRVSAASERLWYRMLVNTDDFGRIDGRLAILKAACFPLQDVPLDDIARSLTELMAPGVDLVWVYRVDGKPVIQFRNWHKFNHLRNQNSKHPHWPGWVRGYSHPSEIPGAIVVQAFNEHHDQALALASNDAGLQAIADNCQQLPTIADNCQQLHVDSDSDSDSDSDNGAPHPTPPAPVGEGGEEEPHHENRLDAALYWLGRETGPDGKKVNPVAVVAGLYTERFGATFPPDYGRLGRMGKALSGSYFTLAQIIWSAPAVQGNPHDYLAGVVRRHPALIKQESKSGSKASALAPVDPQLAQIRRLREQQRQQGAA